VTRNVLFDLRLGAWRVALARYPWREGTLMLAYVGRRSWVVRWPWTANAVKALAILALWIAACVEG
jgi:hypothetical protein